MAELIKLVEGASATYEGEIHTLARATDKFTVDVNFTNQGGAVTSLIVYIFGYINRLKSQRLLKKVIFDSADLLAQGAMFHISNKGVAHLQAKIEIIDTGTSSVDVETTPIYT
ncbi:hypothetical protein ACFL2K_01070 [Candidatus Margulisiibacteriota bacterium]